jgi:hypothetical protein
MASVSIDEPYLSLLLLPGSKYIRVLDVEQAPGSQLDSDSVHGNIRVIDLDQNPTPAFSALSYVWGPHSTLPKTILCGAIAITVTDSCHSALLHLRGKIGSFTIWIDAICINRASRDEKEQQIPLMGDIYSQAKQVYVWLGDGNPGTDRAIEYMRTCGLLKYFFVNGNPESDALQRPRIWKAFLDTYLSRWSFAKYFNPFIKDGMLLYIISNKL